MKRLFLPLILVIMALVAIVPAQAMDSCSLDPTVQSLHMCVAHAVTEGFIDSSGVATSLVAKLDAAQAALDRGQPSVAVSILKTFINEVGAQAGVHINAEHAAHMQMHAQMVIDALQQ